MCHETIYQALYLGGRGGLTRELTKRLRTGRPLRKRRRRPDQRRPRFTIPGTPIDRRPAVVADRTRIGDWEGDLIVGRGNRSAIATLVCRTSRYLRLVRLPDRHAAAAVSDALATCFGQLPLAVRLTQTWDQGSEMAHHDRISRHLAEG
ncbi:IS30 family transposase [Prauserella flavalba]|uniref:IS30 family transposase n=1 Tax=Prauserella flavalba TaxID=1477506 RepID=UPI0036E53368